MARVTGVVHVSLLFTSAFMPLLSSSKRHLNEADALLSKKRKVEDHSGSSSGRKSSRKLFDLWLQCVFSVQRRRVLFQVSSS